LSMTSGTIIYRTLGNGVRFLCMTGMAHLRKINETQYAGDMIELQGVTRPSSHMYRILHTSTIHPPCRFCICGPAYKDSSLHCQNVLLSFQFLFL